MKDFLWVLQAFLRGKILRQKAYKFENDVFKLPVPMTANRLLMLFHWWGFRLMTVDQLASFCQKTKEKKVETEVSFKPISVGWMVSGEDGRETNPFSFPREEFIFRHCSKL